MENFYKSAIEKSPIGYAYHRIIPDDTGKPVDDEFIDVNPPFRKMTGLKYGDIIGKRVTEIIPGIKEESLDWIGYYEGIPLNRGDYLFR
ncbi:MAG: PAS domain-containing protein [Brevinematales bacterium]|nr:PAS domain-containing protein [Brevinematales bacterium]